MVSLKTTPSWSEHNRGPWGTPAAAHEYITMELLGTGPGPGLVQPDQDQAGRGGHHTTARLPTLQDALNHPPQDQGPEQPHGLLPAGCTGPQPVGEQLGVGTTGYLVIPSSQ